MQSFMVRWLLHDSMGLSIVVAVEEEEDNLTG